MIGWGGYKGPEQVPPEDIKATDDMIVATVPDYETAAVAEYKVMLMPRKVRGNLLLLRYLYHEHPEKVR